MSTKEPGGNSSMEESLRVLFADVFQQVSKRHIQPEVNVTFYPFVGLNHTIRIRNQCVYVRVSDILRDAPQAVYRALAHILVGKLFNRRPKVEHEILYRQYVYQPQVLRASDLARQRRGRKQLNGSVGRTYDLDRIFARLNCHYFENALSKPALSWSTRLAATKPDSAIFLMWALDTLTKAISIQDKIAFSTRHNAIISNSLIE